MELTVRENVIIYGRYFGLPRKSSARGPTAARVRRSYERGNDKVEPLSAG